MDVGPCANAIVARISLTGELGYEITVPSVHHRALWKALVEFGEPFGMRQIGNRALESLRHEKGYGIWSTEFTQEYTPHACGLDKFIDFEKKDFVGKAAVVSEASSLSSSSSSSSPRKQKLVQLEILDDANANAHMLDPIMHKGKLVGSVTSGAYGHHVKKNLALAYVDADIVDMSTRGDAAAQDLALTVHIVGEPQRATILREAPYDPKGKKLRS
jgi:dimethylglycine dehydrogenase